MESILECSQDGKEALENLLENNDIEVDATSDEGRTALMEASRLGNDDAINVLIESGADVNVQDQVGCTALMLAAAEGHMETVNVLLENGAEVDILDKRGYTALMTACEMGCTDIVSFLVDASADVNIQNKHGQTALMIAIETCLEETAQELLGCAESKIDLYAEDASKRNVLVYALERRMGSLVELLLEMDREERLAYVEIETERGCLTPLILAAENNMPEAVTLLLDKHCETSYYNKFGYSALTIAIEHGFEEVVDALLANNKVRDFISSTDEEGLVPPLYLACSKGNGRVANLLLDRGAECDTDPTTELNALHAACTNKLEDVALRMLKKNAIFATSKSGKTVLMVACEAGLLKVASKIAAIVDDHRKSFEGVDKDGNTAMLIACAHGHVEIVHALFKFGASLEAINKAGETFLHVASRAGNLSALEEYVGEFESLEGRDKRGRTPLLVACAFGQEAVAAYLLQKGARAEVESQDEESALFLLLACQQRCSVSEDHFLHLASTLVQSCPNINKSKRAVRKLNLAAKKPNKVNGTMGPKAATAPRLYQEQGTTVLHIASIQGLDAVVKMILEAGADVNARVVTGESPLYFACLHNHQSTALVLLLWGADTNVVVTGSGGNNSTTVASTAEKVVCSVCSGKLSESAQGDTPLCAASAHGNLDLVAALVFHGAKIGLKTADGRTAFSVAVRNQHFAVVRHLCLHDLPISSDGSSRDHCGTWTELVDPTRGVPLENILFIVLEVLSQTHEGTNPQQRAYALAHVKDSNGRTALSIAHEQVQDLFKKFMFFCGRYEILHGPPLYRSATAIVLRATDHSVAQDYAHYFQQFAEDNDGELDSELFRECVRSLGVVSGSEATSEELLKSFAICAKSNPKAVSLHEFVTYCCNFYGTTRKVVIKFMHSGGPRDEEQYRREQRMREKYDLASNYVVGLLSGPAEDVFAAAARTQVLSDGTSLADYQYGLFMPAADRDLETILRAELPTMNQVRVMARDLAMALAHMHEKKVMHGDVKPLNALRVYDKIALIDLDAAAPFDSGEASGFAGAKFTSAYLPPEMFYKLTPAEEKQYNAYWAAEKADNTVLWQKIEPKRTANGKVRSAYVVRTFDLAMGSDETGVAQVRDASALPYTLLPASDRIDVWAFGVTLFRMCANHDMFLLDKHGDVAKPSDVAMLHAWGTDPSSLDALIANEVKDAGAASLLRLILLQPDPALRPSMTEILKHAFFSEGGNAIGEEILKEMRSLNTKLTEISEFTKLIYERTQEIKDMSDQVFLQIRKTEQVMLKGMFEATEVTVPSCFIILNQLIEPEPDVNELKEESVVAVGGKSAKRKASMENALVWMGKLSQLGEVVSDSVGMAMGVASGSKEAIMNAIASLIPDTKSDQKLYLYLVDEYDMKPVYDPTGNFPIPITTPAEFIPKILPLLKVSLKAAAVVNGVAGLGRCLGYPVPTIPADLMDRASRIVGNLGQESSVAEYEVLQGQVTETLAALKVSSDGAATKLKHQNVRGAALRDLENFFATEVRSKNFSGLQRMVTREGYSCWTLPHNAERMRTDEHPPMMLSAQLAASAAAATVLAEEAVASAQLAIEAVTLTEPAVMPDASADNEACVSAPAVPEPKAEEPIRQPPQAASTSSAEGGAEPVTTPEKKKKKKMAAPVQDEEPAHAAPSTPTPAPSPIPTPLSVPISEANAWKIADKCQFKDCGQVFSLPLHRRHHCRKCGHSFCGRHCPKTLLKARWCVDCKAL